MKYEYAPGLRFGRLTLVELGAIYVKPSGDRCRRWVCRCDCGAEKLVPQSNLAQGDTQSCGCLQKERAKAAAATCLGHAGKRSSTWRVWKGMVRRCVRPLTAHERARYADRGITVCSRWLGKDGFRNFLADMGERPAGLTIDRINNDGHYDPSNCRWATRMEQSANTSRTRFLSDGTVRLHLREWSRRLGFSYGTISRRLASGWTEHEAVTLPKGSRRPL